MRARKVVIHVFGWTGCQWYKKAAQLASSLQLLYPSQYESALHESPTSQAYDEALRSQRDLAQDHTTSPFVYVSQGNGDTFVGGCDKFVDWARALLPGPDVDDRRMIDDGFGGAHSYDYDVVVVGGGSGGLACSKECARLGAKVAVVDFVKPSPAGSSWGLGGTCVNVGCIPKKLMHNAALIRETIGDAADFGWKAGLEPHDWSTLRDNVQGHVKSLNFGYRVSLRENGIDYLNKLGRFVDAHTLELTDRKGHKSVVTSARFVVAVGGRPTRLKCEGAEHCIDSDDIFQLDRDPGRVLCVGGGYIAMECAGFLSGLGYPATCMIRSVPLRGFDRECVDRIAQHMDGVTLQLGATPVKIERVDDVFRVTDSTGGQREYDTVLAAVGRTADTSGLGLENVPGALDCLNPANHKLQCEHEQLATAPHVYAVGDVVDARPELTPVAIEAGLRLARRLYGDADDFMDYDNVATTIFTPLEYGTIGLTEEAASDLLGDDLDVYVSDYLPLEFALSGRGGAFAKLLADKSRNGRIVGFHYLGPNAGEVTQGFALAIRKGATYTDFVNTVGIHPTVAEEFTSMTITKASGLSAKKAGC